MFIYKPANGNVYAVPTAGHTPSPLRECCVVFRVGPRLQVKRFGCKSWCVWHSGCECVLSQLYAFIGAPPLLCEICLLHRQTDRPTDSAVIRV